MSRQVIIRNGSSSVKNVKDKSEKLIEFGNQYHVCFGSLDIPTFDLSSENIGGIVTYKNKPFGVVGVPSSITGDNSIRVMSIALMSGLNPKTGSTSLTFSDNENIVCICFQNYDYSSTNPPLNTYEEKTIPSTINSSNFYDGWARHKIWIDLTDSRAVRPNWRTDKQILMISAANSGRVNRGFSEGHMCTWRYSPIEGLNTTGYWYVPGLYELAIEGRNKATIEASFAQILSQYNYGPGRIPYRTDSRSDGFMTSDYNNPNWYGGRVGKYSIYSNSPNWTNYASAQDGNTVQAWCKLIKENNEWILDPSYHID